MFFYFWSEEIHVGRYRQISIAGKDKSVIMTDLDSELEREGKKIRKKLTSDGVQR